MHGLVNRAIQCFVRDTYGPDAWMAVANRADIEPVGFESMLIYEDSVTETVLAAACAHLDKPRDVLLEDLGTYLVSHPNLEALRRLLRFGGANFVDFLHSVDELPDRIRLAMPDLDFPRLELSHADDGIFRLDCIWHTPGFGHVMVGLLRTLADDYGALALLESVVAAPGRERVDIHLLDTGFATGRAFDLASGL